jgi:hypothetical protein
VLALPWRVLLRAQVPARGVAAHNSACKSAVAAAASAAASAAAATAATGAAAAAAASGAGPGGGGGTGGLDGVTLRRAEAAVALLGSRKAKDRAAGVQELDDLNALVDGRGNNRMLREFQDVAAAAIGALVRMAAHGEEEIWAVRVLGSLTHFNRDTIAAVAAQGGIPPLVEALRSRSAAVRDAAVMAIGNLSIDKANKVAIVAAGGLPPLLQMLNSPRPDVVDTAAGVLRNLVRNESNCAAFTDAVGLAGPRLAAGVALEEREFLGRIRHGSADAPERGCWVCHRCCRRAPASRGAVEVDAFRGCTKSSGGRAGRPCPEGLDNRCRRRCRRCALCSRC